jgi:hypothetical protein
VLAPVLDRVEDVSEVAGSIGCGHVRHENQIIRSGSALTSDPMRGS